MGTGPCPALRPVAFSDSPSRPLGTSDLIQPLPEITWPPSLQIGVFLSLFPPLKPGIALLFSWALPSFGGLCKKWAGGRAAGFPLALSSLGDLWPLLRYQPHSPNTARDSLGPFLVCVSSMSACPSVHSLHACAPPPFPVPLAICPQRGREALKGLCRDTGQKKINGICNKSRSKVVT